MYERFKRVLVTTDFSETADHAIGHAFRVAADHGAEVLLCHVMEAVLTPNPLYAHYYPSDFVDPHIHEQAELHTRHALLDRAPQEDPLGRVPRRALVARGAPVEEILRMAREHDVDLLVISTRGRTGLTHILLGSVAERVIRHAHCPVLVVR